MRTEPLIPAHPEQNQNARDYLTAVNLDWRNNYLSYSKYAEHNGLTPQQALDLIRLAVTVATTEHPDA